MPETIIAPGIFTDIDPADYHADPCPQPSVSQSLIKTLLDQSPAHARAEHARLSPVADEADDEPEKYDKVKAIGDAVHFLLLDRGKHFAIGQFPNWQTKLAKEFKADALAGNCIPILDKHWAIAETIEERARDQLAARGLAEYFRGEAGHSEVVLAWHEGGRWRRTMIDRLAADRRLVLDVKTTGRNAAPQAVGTLMADAGWPIQGAMHERGLDILDPDNAGRRRHVFVVIEQYPPYALVVYEIGEALLHMGRKRLQIGLDIWDECMRTGRWPAYPIETQYPELPGWTEQKWTAREIEHADRRREPIADDHFMAG
jgi:hypothetical protein